MSANTTNSLFDPATRERVSLEFGEREHQLTIDLSRVSLSAKYHSSPTLVEDILDQACWKNGPPSLSEANLPIRTRSLELPALENSNIAIKLKGAGGLQRLRNAVRLLQADPQQQCKVGEVVIRLDEKLNLSCVTLQIDHERALEYSNAHTEFMVSEHLAQEKLTFKPIIAAAFNKDGKPFASSLGEQLGFVALERDTSFRTLHSSFGYSPAGNSDYINLTFADSLELYKRNDALQLISEVEALKAQIRMRAIIECGLTGHMPHNGNFLANFDSLLCKNKELTDRLRLSDLDECTTEQTKDVSSLQRSANLICEVGFGIFRSTLEMLQKQIDFANKSLVFEVILPQHIRTVVNGYFEPYLGNQKCQQISNELNDSLSDLCEAYDDEIRFASNLNILGIRTNLFMEICLFKFRLKCLTTVHQAVLHSERFRELDYIPAIYGQRDLFSRLKDQYVPYLKEEYNQMFNFANHEFPRSELLAKKLKSMLRILG